MTTAVPVLRSFLIGPRIPVRLTVRLSSRCQRQIVLDTIDPQNVIVGSNDDRTRCWDAITARHLGDIADSDCSTVAGDDGQIVVAAGHDDGSVEIIRWDSDKTVEQIEGQV
jgi:hypothetical protein